MDHQSIGEIIREEWKKLFALTWKERLVYIWDYYKPLMVGILGIICCISIGVSIYHNKQLNYLVSVYMVDCNMLDVPSEEIATDFAAYLGGMGEHDVVTVDTSVQLNAEDMSQYGMANQMKFTALIAAGDIDLAFFTPEAYERFREAGTCTDLTEVLSEEQLEQWSDLLVYGAQPDEDETETEAGSGNTAEQETGAEHVRDASQKEAADEVPLALNLQNAPMMQKYNAYYGEPVYAVIVVNGKNPEMAARFLTYLLQESA